MLKFLKKNFLKTYRRLAINTSILIGSTLIGSSIRYVDKDNVGISTLAEKKIRFYKSGFHLFYPYCSLYQFSTKEKVDSIVCDINNSIMEIEFSYTIDPFHNPESFKTDAINNMFIKHYIKNLILNSIITVSDLECKLYNETLTNKRRDDGINLKFNISKSIINKCKLNELIDDNNGLKRKIDKLVDVVAISAFINIILGLGISVFICSIKIV